MSRNLLTLAAAFVLALVLALLNRGLRPETFWAGDSGAKLTAARAAIDDPRHPFNIPLPRIGADAAPDLLGPLYVAHGDHSHAITSPLFPLLTAPLLATLGWRGLYVLPALGWLATLGLIARARRVDAAPAAWSAVVVAIGTPLLFYGLEFWEHATAVSLTTAATVTALPGRSRWMGCGALIGLAFLFRPEALWFGAALVLAPAWNGLPRRAARWTLGFALALVPSTLYNLLHFGTLLGPHLTSNADAATLGWLPLRAMIARSWFLDGPVPILAPALVALVTGAIFVRQPRRRHVGRLLVFAATLGLAVVAARRGLVREGLWATFPLVGLAFLGEGQAFLRRAALIFIAFAWLTAPNDGGAQWGPRYLLPACVPLALLVAEATWPLVRSRSWVQASYVCALVMASLWLQRSMYRDLRIAKAMYATVTSGIASAAQDSTYVLSDVPWIDLVAASERPRITFLYVHSPVQASATLDRLQRAHVGSVLLVRSRKEMPAGTTAEWLRSSCYRTGPNDRGVGPDLVAVRAFCEGWMESARPARAPQAALRENRRLR